MPFHNPYTFVPTPPRTGILRNPLSRTAPQEDATAEARALAFLGDHDPSDPSWQEDHSCFWPGKYSGDITVKMTVKTPLFIPKTPEKNNVNGHKTYDCHEIPPVTSVKGMLRSAYEIITNSRYGVFNQKTHTEQLGRRMATEEAKDLVPGMIINDDGVLKVRLMPGLPGDVLKAAWLKRYDSNSNALDRRAPNVGTKYVGTTRLPVHRDKVIFQKQNMSKPDRFDYYEVTSIWPKNHPAAPQVDNATVFEGIVCVTNPTVNKKHHERVFFVDPTPADVTLTTKNVADYQKLIASYKSLHKKEIADRLPHAPGDYLGGNPGETAWGKYVYDDAWDTLIPDDPASNRAGSLVYVRFEGIEITGLFPAMISRDLHPKTALECFPDPQGLLQAKEIGELSPADRLFGWVNPKGKGAWKGKLRIGAVEKADNYHLLLFDEPMPLTILGQPKPAQSRFYLGRQTGRKLNNGNPKVQVRYAGQNKLRGRKVYWHHKGVVGNEQYWGHPWSDRTTRQHQHYYQEYHQTNGEGERSDQNRSITGWIAPGSEYIFTIHVENLSKEELGALTTLLSLETYPDLALGELYLKFGGAKPLGLGTIKLELQEYKLRENSDWAEYYYSDPFYAWNDEADTWLQQEGLADCIQVYKQRVLALYGNNNAANWHDVDFIKNFLITCGGPTTNNPVHYPRNAQNRYDACNDPIPAFKWFSDNESRKGQKLCLPDADSDKGLPHDPTNLKRGGKS